MCFWFLFFLLKVLFWSHLHVTEWIYYGTSIAVDVWSRTTIVPRPLTESLSTAR